MGRARLRLHTWPNACMKLVFCTGLPLIWQQKVVTVGRRVSWLTSRLRRTPPRRPRSLLRFACCAPPPRPSADRLSRKPDGFGGRSMLARGAESRLNVASRSPSRPEALRKRHINTIMQLHSARKRCSRGKAFPKESKRQVDACINVQSDSYRRRLRATSPLILHAP